VSAVILTNVRETGQNMEGANICPCEGHWTIFKLRADRLENMFWKRMCTNPYETKKKSYLYSVH
jgi:hypothetical protein